MRALPLLMASLALLAAAPAAAADWWRVDSTDAGRTYVDLQSVTPSGDVVVATHILVYRTLSGQGVKVATAVSEFDCTRRITRYRRFSTVDAAGKSLMDVAEPDKLADHAAQPGTVGGSILEFVCGTSRNRAIRVADPFTDKT